MSRQLITAKRSQLIQHLYEAERVFPTLPIYRILNKISELKDTYIAYATQEKGKISFATSKEYKYDVKRRQMTTFGRIVRRHLEEDESFNIKDNDLDKVQRYLLYKLGVTKRYEGEVKVLTGKDILNAYADSVGYTSCMTGPDNIKYLDLYSKNPEKIALLVTDTHEGSFRALRWLLDNGKYVYDRPYPEGSNNINILREMAVGNGYVRGTIPILYPRNERYCPSDMPVNEYSREYAELNKEMKVTVNKPMWLPFRDTFRWYKPYDRKKYMELAPIRMPGFCNFDDMIRVTEAVQYYKDWVRDC